MILVINTADSEQVFIGLVKDGKWIVKKQFKAKASQAEKLLPEIDKLVSSQVHKLASLKSIVVISGPASFTALRIGVITANTLAWSLKIPITSFKLNEFKDLDDLAKKVSSKNKNEVIVKPFYGKAPNITKKKYAL